jgi:hypothetical protein
LAGTAAIVRSCTDWSILERESATLPAADRGTCRRQGIAQGELAIHAARRSSMTSKLVVFLIADFRVTNTHSRFRGLTST